LQTPPIAATSKPEALVNAAKFTAPPPRIAGSADKLNDVCNNLISKHYFSISLFYRLAVAGKPGQQLNAQGRNLAESEAFLISLSENAVRLRQSVCVFMDVRCNGDGRSAQLQAAADSSVEPNTLRRH
jgi:hypothetical protein